MSLGIFRDGVLIETVAVDPGIDPATAAYDRMHALAAVTVPPGMPNGYEVLRICPTHPTRSVVDCEDCEPEETS